MIDAVDEEAGEDNVSPHSPYNTRSSRKQEDSKMVLVYVVICLSRRTTWLLYVVLVSLLIHVNTLIYITYMG